MAIPQDITYVWPGTHASIPAGFVRNTTPDGKYVLGASIGNDGGSTGGSATHVHPNASTHSHTFAGGAGIGSTTVPIGIAKGMTTVTHAHASLASNVTATTFGTASNDPPYHEVIYIKSSGTNDVPAGVGAWFDDTLPTNWNESDGGGSRPDLRNLYLKGAGTGADSGATGGSLDAHGHTSNHGHASKLSGKPSVTSLGPANSGTRSLATGLHTHAVTLNTASANVNNADGQPPYYKLVTAINETGGEDKPLNMIALWFLLETNIPSEWERFASIDDNFLKSASGVGEIGNTGGSDTHVHTCAAHNHGSTAGTGAGIVKEWFSPVISLSTQAHTHVWTIGNATISVPANVSKANYPSYVTGIFIKYVGPSFTPFTVINTT